MKPMFSLNAIGTKVNSVSVNKFNDEQTLTIQFPVELKLHSVSEADDNFDILNMYLDYKGEEFKENLFNEYNVIDRIINDYVMASTDTDVIKHKFILELSKIINLLDYEEIFTYITQVNKIPILSTLKEEFDIQIEKDGEGTKAQTYTINEYKQLMALIVIIKAIYGPLSSFIMGNDDDYKKDAEMQMLDVLDTTSMNRLVPFHKLNVYVDAVVKGVFNNKDAKAANIKDTKVLSLKRSREDIPRYFLAKAMFNRIITLSQLADPEEFDIIRHLFKDINSKLKNDGGPKEPIRAKNTPSGSESESEDKESVFESYRQHTPITPGDIVEHEYVTGSIDIILDNISNKLKEVINEKDLKEADAVLDHTPVLINNTTINIIGVIFSGLIHPRILPSLPFENIRNLQIVGYAILKGINVPQLAYILLSARAAGSSENVEDIDVSLNVNVNTTNAKGYRTQELENIHGLKDANGELVILKWVNSMYTIINRYKWVCKLNNITNADICVSILKDVLIDFLIEIETRKED